MTTHGCTPCTICGARCSICDNCVHSPTWPFENIGEPMSKVYVNEDFRQVWIDLVYLSNNGEWKDGIPDWASDLANRFNTFAGSPSVLMYAYEYVARNAMKIVHAGDSISAKKARIVAQEKNSNLRADDHRFQKSITVHMKDGSEFKTIDAFAETYIDDDGNDWLFIFAEHYPVAIYSMDEVERVSGRTTSNSS